MAENHLALRLTDRCGPFKTGSLNSLSVIECRRVSPFATGVAVRKREQVHRDVSELDRCRHAKLAQPLRQGEQPSIKPAVKRPPRKMQSFSHHLMASNSIYVAVE